MPKHHQVPSTSRLLSIGTHSDSEYFSLPESASGAAVQVQGPRKTPSCQKPPKTGRNPLRQHPGQPPIPEVYRLGHGLRHHSMVAVMRHWELAEAVPHLGEPAHCGRRVGPSDSSLSKSKPCSPALTLEKRPFSNETPSGRLLPQPRFERNCGSGRPACGFLIAPGWDRAVHDRTNPAPEFPGRLPCPTTSRPH